MVECLASTRSTGPRVRRCQQKYWVCRWLATMSEIRDSGMDKGAWSMDVLKGRTIDLLCCGMNDSEKVVKKKADWWRRKLLAIARNNTWLFNSPSTPIRSIQRGREDGEPMRECVEKDEMKERRKRRGTRSRCRLATDGLNVATEATTQRTSIGCKNLFRNKLSIQRGRIGRSSILRFDPNPSFGCRRVCIEGDRRTVKERYWSYIHTYSLAHNTGSFHTEWNNSRSMKCFESLSVRGNTSVDQTVHLIQQVQLAD